jgi:hypothetical protein
MPKDVFNVANSWIMVPAATHASEKWLMTLSGIADINLRGVSTADWHHETFVLHLDWRSPAAFAHGTSVPPGQELFFEVEQWAPFAALSSVYDAGHSLDAGFAVDSCVPRLERRAEYGTDAVHTNLFEGLEIAAGVRDADAYLFKIAFQVTLLGRLVCFAAVEPQ